MNLFHILICGFCTTATATAAAEWQVEKHIDEILDETSYTITTTGDAYDVTRYVKSKPTLIIRITPGGLNKDGQLLAKQEVIIDFEPDAITRDGATAIVRFGKANAQPWECSPSTTRNATFPENASKFITYLKSADDLYFRFETSLGAIRTLHFDTSNLSAKIKELVATASAALNDNAPPANPPLKLHEVRCRKCRGSGHVELWQKCSSCNGSTRGCDQCRNSGWIGHQKAVKECPKCKGIGTIAAK